MEALAMKLGLPSSDLTLSQRRLKIARLTATSGAAVGVVVGCLLGMGTLLFMDTTHAEREKKQVQHVGYFKIERAKLIHAIVIFLCFFSMDYLHRAQKRGMYS